LQLLVFLLVFDLCWLMESQQHDESQRSHR